MAKFLVIVIFGVIAVAHAQRGGARATGDENQRRVTTTPVPILRQINKVGEDGSYTYGYESADGSYKIETKSANGEVQGKYGYYDDTGALREIEYGASRQGFNPQGTDVKLPQSAPAMAHHEFDDTGAYDANRYDRPFAYDPSSYQQPQEQQVRRPAAAGRRPGARRPKQQQQFTQFASFPQSAPAPQQQQQAYQQPQQFPAPAPQQAYQQPQQQAYQQPQHHNVVNHQSPAPAPVNPHHEEYFRQQALAQQAPTQAPFNPAQLFHGHPARNIDINTGSYSVQYQG